MNPLQNEINTLQVPYKFNGIWYAPASGTPSPSRSLNVDYSAFKKPKGEKELIKEIKKEFVKSKHHKFVTVAHFAI